MYYYSLISRSKVRGQNVHLESRSVSVDFENQPKKLSIFTLFFYISSTFFSPFFFSTFFPALIPILIQFNIFLYIEEWDWIMSRDCPCPDGLSLRARCVLTRPGFDINSQRGGLTLSGAHTTNTPCLSNHFPPASPTIKHNSVFFTLPPVSACTPWRSRLGRERERERLSRCLFICACFLACQDKEGNTEQVWEHNFTPSVLAPSTDYKHTHTHSRDMHAVYTLHHTAT